MPIKTVDLHAQQRSERLRQYGGRSESEEPRVSRLRQRIRAALFAADTLSTSFPRPVALGCSLRCADYMQRWATLNERQLAILRRIGDGVDPVSARSPELASTVYALRNRGLVATPRRDGIWRAEITEAGRFYLEHDHHPDRPHAAVNARPTARDRAGPGLRKASRRPDKAAELMDLLSQNSGTVRIEDPGPDVRAAYRRAISAAKRRGLVPSGSQLLHTGRDSGDLIIKLAKAGTEVQTEWNRVRLKARDEQVAADLFAALEAHPTVLDVSDAARPRALQIVETLARKAERRGHVLAFSRKSRHMHLKVRDHRYMIKIREERDQMPRSLPPGDWRLRASYPWQRITPPEYDLVPSGRLRIELPGLRGDRTDQWADAGRKKIEGSLLDIIEVVERCADQADEEGRERQRQHEKWLATQERHRIEEEKRAQVTREQWDAAMADARELAVADLRKKEFQDAFADWVAASEIREFCTALQESARAHGGSVLMQRWIEWATAWADQLDPTVRPAQFAEKFDPEPGPDDLRPHLGEWSPHRPEEEYRPSSPPKPQPVTSAYAAEASAWRWGRPGRVPWWRR